MKLYEKFLQVDNDSRITKIARALLLLLPLPFITPEIDNDFWFQIKSGETIVKLWPNGFLTEEPFTIHEGWDFSFEKWLTDVSFYEIYTHFGNIGIYLTLIFFAVLLSFVMYKTCKLVSGNKTNSAIITAVCLSFFTFGYMRTRPQIIAYVLLVLEIYVLEKYTQTKNLKLLILLPVLSVVYMQFHSTMWPVFFIFMLPYLCEFKKLAIKGTTAGDYKKLPLLAAFVISIAVGIINPNGFRSILYLIHSSVSEISPYIIDLRPSTYTALQYITPVLLLSCIFYLKRNRKDIPLRYVFFELGTFVMGLTAVRNMSYFILSGTIICAWMYKDAKDEKKKVPKVLVGSIFIVALIYLIPLVTNFVCLEERIYDSTAGKDAIDYLSEYVNENGENKADLKIYTGFNDGSYAEWKDFKCYIDPRGEVFVESINGKEDVFMEYIEFYRGTTKHQVLQDKYNFDYWVVANGATSINYMLDDPDYLKLYEDEEYYVLKYIGSDEQ